VAYMNQQKKQKIATALKPILAKYGMKGSLRVGNHNIDLTLQRGAIDFVADMVQSNQSRVTKDDLRQSYCFTVYPYGIDEHYTGESLAFLREVIPAMKAADWYDRSDAQVDYFDTAYYFTIDVGRWNKPYTLTK